MERTILGPEFKGGVWHSYFANASKKDETLTSILDEKTRFYKLYYPFLEKKQILGKVYEELGIPNICGDVDRKELFKLFLKERKKVLTITKKNKYNSENYSSLPIENNLIHKSISEKARCTLVYSNKSTKIKLNKNYDKIEKTNNDTAFDELLFLNNNSQIAGNNIGMEEWHLKQSKTVRFNDGVKVYSVSPTQSVYKMKPIGRLFDEPSSLRTLNTQLKSDQEIQKDFSDSDSDFDADTGIMSDNEDFESLYSPQSHTSSVERETTESNDIIPNSNIEKGIRDTNRTNYDFPEQDFPSTDSNDTAKEGNNLISTSRMVTIAQGEWVREAEKIIGIESERKMTENLKIFDVDPNVGNDASPVDRPEDCLNENNSGPVKIIINKIQSLYISKQHQGEDVNSNSCHKTKNKKNEINKSDLQQNFLKNGSNDEVMACEMSTEMAREFLGVDLRKSNSNISLEQQSDKSSVNEESMDIVGKPSYNRLFSKADTDESIERRIENVPEKLIDGRVSDFIHDWDSTNESICEKSLLDIQDDKSSLDQDILNGREEKQELGKDKYFDVQGAEETYNEANDGNSFQLVTTANHCRQKMHNAVKSSSELKYAKNDILLNLCNQPQDAKVKTQMQLSDCKLKNSKCSKNSTALHISTYLQSSFNKKCNSVVATGELINEENVYLNTVYSTLHSLLTKPIIIESQKEDKVRKNYHFNVSSTKSELLEEDPIGANPCEGLRDIVEPQNKKTQTVYLRNLVHTESQKEDVKPFSVENKRSSKILQRNILKESMEDLKIKSRNKVQPHLTSIISVNSQDRKKSKNNLEAYEKHKKEEGQEQSCNGKWNKNEQEEMDIYQGHIAFEQEPCGVNYLSKVEMWSMHSKEYIDEVPEKLTSSSQALICNTDSLQRAIVESEIFDYDNVENYFESSANSEFHENLSTSEDHKTKSQEEQTFDSSYASTPMKVKDLKNSEELSTAYETDLDTGKLMMNCHGKPIATSTPFKKSAVSCKSEYGAMNKKNYRISLESFSETFSDRLGKGNDKILENDLKSYKEDDSKSGNYDHAKEYIQLSSANSFLNIETTSKGTKNISNIKNDRSETADDSTLNTDSALIDLKNTKGKEKTENLLSTESQHVNQRSSESIIRDTDHSNEQSENEPQIVKYENKNNKEVNQAQGKVIGQKYKSKLKYLKLINLAKKLSRKQNEIEKQCNVACNSKLTEDKRFLHRMKVNRLFNLRSSEVANIRCVYKDNQSSESIMYGTDQRNTSEFSNEKYEMVQSNLGNISQQVEHTDINAERSQSQIYTGDLNSPKTYTRVVENIVDEQVNNDSHNIDEVLLERDSKAGNKQCFDEVITKLKETPKRYVKTSQDDLSLNPISISDLNCDKEGFQSETPQGTGKEKLQKDSTKLELLEEDTIERENPCEELMGIAEAQNKTTQTVNKSNKTSLIRDMICPDSCNYNPETKSCNVVKFSSEFDYFLNTEMETNVMRQSKSHNLYGSYVALTDNVYDKNYRQLKGDNDLTPQTSDHISKSKSSMVEDGHSLVTTQLTRLQSLQSTNHFTLKRKLKTIHEISDDSVSHEKSSLEMVQKVGNFSSTTNESLGTHNTEKSITDTGSNSVSLKRVNTNLRKKRAKLIKQNPIKRGSTSSSEDEVKLTLPFKRKMLVLDKITFDSSGKSQLPTNIKLKEFLKETYCKNIEKANVVSEQNRRDPCSVYKKDEKQKILPNLDVPVPLQSYKHNGNSVKIKKEKEDELDQQITFMNNLCLKQSDNTEKNVLIDSPISLCNISANEQQDQRNYFYRIQELEKKRKNTDIKATEIIETDTALSCNESRGLKIEKTIALFNESSNKIVEHAGNSQKVSDCSLRENIFHNSKEWKEEMKQDISTDDSSNLNRPKVHKSYTEHKCLDVSLQGNTKINIEKGLLYDQNLLEMKLRNIKEKSRSISDKFFSGEKINEKSHKSFQINRRLEQGKNINNVNLNLKSKKFSELACMESKKLRLPLRELSTNELYKKNESTETIGKKQVSLPEEKKVKNTKSSIVRWMESIETTQMSRTPEVNTLLRRTYFMGNNK